MFILKRRWRREFCINHKNEQNIITSFFNIERKNNYEKV